MNQTNLTAHNETGGHRPQTPEMKNAYKILVGKPGGKTPDGESGYRWENNIKINLREVGLESEDWMHVARERDRWRALVNKVMNLWVS
jgi:hypothetical protein